MGEVSSGFSQDAFHLANLPLIFPLMDSVVLVFLI
jgi:hypothetical protein